LLGEPVRWETNLQLITDLLITNGSPVTSPLSPPEEHIPVIAANTDLIYMSEVPLPRYLLSFTIDPPPGKLLKIKEKVYSQLRYCS